MQHVAMEHLNVSQQEVIVVDGAVGDEISRLGGGVDSAAWCSVANKTHPEVVCRVHELCIRAGADVVTANTFATCAMFCPEQG